MTSADSRKKNSKRKVKDQPVIVKLAHRTVPLQSRFMILVDAGGRCEFRGHNQFLLENPVTHRRGLFAEFAHIVAFSVSGPRGSEEPRPNNIHDPANLMLLCPTCHKEIDDNSQQYSRSVLENHKKEHEDRVKHLTNLGPELETTIVQLKSNIGGKPVAIPAQQIADAVRPRYPDHARGCVIDLTALRAKDDSFLEAAEQTIKHELGLLMTERLRGNKPRHLSVFALAPMPILMLFGSQLSDKLAVDFFQFHRDSKNWTWKTGGGTVRYSMSLQREGKNPEHVALVLSLSGTISLGDLPSAIDESFSIYVISLDGQTPSPSFLRTRSDLEAFRRTYEDFISTITARHGTIDSIHLFPAVPAPVAVACGHDLLQKVHPSLVVYDYDKTRNGFTNQLRIN